MRAGSYTGQRPRNPRLYNEGGQEKRDRASLPEKAQQQPPPRPGAQVEGHRQTGDLSSGASFSPMAAKEAEGGGGGGGGGGLARGQLLPSAHLWQFQLQCPPVEERPAVDCREPHPEERRHGCGIVHQRLHRRDRCEGERMREARGSVNAAGPALLLFRAAGGEGRRG